MKDKIYLIWNDLENDDGPDEECGYWDIYLNFLDAVSASCGREIYTARPRLLGKYKMMNKPVRIKSRKKK